MRMSIEEVIVLASLRNLERGPLQRFGPMNLSHFPEYFHFGAAPFAILPVRRTTLHSLLDVSAVNPLVIHALIVFGGYDFTISNL